MTALMSLLSLVAAAGIIWMLIDMANHKDDDDDFPDHGVAA